MKRRKRETETNEKQMPITQIMNSQPLLAYFKAMAR